MTIPTQIEFLESSKYPSLQRHDLFIKALYELGGGHVKQDDVDAAVQVAQV